MAKALFLDRDGTVNVDYGYVFKPDDFHLISGVIDFCKKAPELGYLIIVITNQSGIARGYYTVADYEQCTRYMIEQFKKEGVNLTDVFYCPDLSGPDRKPECGLFLKARDKYHIDMAESVSVGDKDRDIAAAKKAGVGRNFLFQNNYADLTKKL